MPLTFLSPLGLLVALAVALPLLGLAVLERRAARVRNALRLDAPDPRRRLELAGALVAVAVLLGSPPPAAAVGNRGGRASTLGALTSLATKNYFRPTATHRLVIVLGDDESQPFAEAGIGAVFRKPPRVRTIFVHVWRSGERI